MNPYLLASFCGLIALAVGLILLGAGYFLKKKQSNDLAAFIATDMAEVFRQTLVQATEESMDRIPDKLRAIREEIEEGN